MKTAYNRKTVEEYKNGLVHRASNIAKDLQKLDFSPFSRKRKIDTESIQQNLLYFDEGFNPSDECWGQLSNRPATPTLWDFVKLAIGSHDSLRVSKWNYVQSLIDLVRQGLDSRLVDEVAGTCPRRAGLFTSSLVLAFPASILDLSLVENFQDSHLRLADNLCGIGKIGQAGSVRRTAVTTVRRARWFFSEKRRPIYDKTRKKFPPNLDGFMNARLLETEKISYVAPTPDHFRQLLAELPRLAREDMPVYRFILLTLWVGLRAAEAVAARGAWVIDSTKEPRMNVRPEVDFMVKTGQSRLAWIPPCVFGELKLRSSSTYIVADLKCERWRAYQSTLALLKKIGFVESMPVHYLRRFYFSAVAQHLGLDEAKESAGHHTHQVGFGHYLFQSFSLELKQLWLSGPSSFQGKS